MKVFGRYDGGIGNRINGIMNLMMCYRSRQEEIYECTLEWISNKTWSSEYEDLFEPIPDMKIINVGKACNSIDELREHFHNDEINKNYTEDREGSVRYNAEYKGLYEGPLTTDIEIEGSASFWNIRSIDKEDIWKFFPKPNKELIDETKKIISDLNIDQSAAGMHIRDTDHPSRQKLEVWERVIEREDKKVFIVSDSNEIKQQLINKYPDKVIAQLHENTLFKLTPDRKWDEAPVDGFKSEYNVASPAPSCKQSMIDMLLLSYVYPDYGIRESTFSENANRYNYAEWWND